jgi:hypothetical protein
MSNQKKAKNNAQNKLRSYKRKYKRLSAELAKTGFIWPGSIQWRWIKCGKPNCACNHDPKMRHGPYIYWTSKKGQKTISKLLSSKEAELFEEWINNRREMERIIQEMKNLSKKASSVALKATESKENNSG